MTTPCETLDLYGVPCPINAARALLALEGLPPGASLRVELDDGEPIRNLPAALEEQGHSVTERTRTTRGWSLVIRRAEES